MIRMRIGKRKLLYSHLKYRIMHPQQQQQYQHQHQSYCMRYSYNKYLTTAAAAVAAIMSTSVSVSNVDAYRIIHQYYSYSTPSRRIVAMREHRKCNNIFGTQHQQQRYFSMVQGKSSALKKKPHDNDNYESDDIVREKTLQWLRNIVIGYNLCPFAYTPYIQNQIRIVIVRFNNNNNNNNNNNSDMINPILQTVIAECDLLLQSIHMETEQQQRKEEDEKLSNSSSSSIKSSNEVLDDAISKTTTTTAAAAAASTSSTTTNYPTTTLIVCPECYPNHFEQYLDIVHVLEDMIELGYDDDGNVAMDEINDEDDDDDNVRTLVKNVLDAEEKDDNVNTMVSSSDQVSKETYNNPYYGQIQIASFHPQYCFAGSTNVNEPDNVTNQSPYPIFHLLRELDITNVVTHLLPNQDASVVWSRNVDLLQTLHNELTETEFQSIFHNNNKNIREQLQRDDELYKELQSRVRQIVRRFPIHLLKSSSQQQSSQPTMNEPHQ